MAVYPPISMLSWAIYKNKTYKSSTEVTVNHDL